MVAAVSMQRPAAITAKRLGGRSPQGGHIFANASNDDSAMRVSSTIATHLVASRASQQQEHMFQSSISSFHHTWQFMDSHTHLQLHVLVHIARINQHSRGVADSRRQQVAAARAGGHGDAVGARRRGLLRRDAAAHAERFYNEPLLLCLQFESRKVTHIQFHAERDGETMQHCP